MNVEISEILKNSNKIPYDYELERIIDYKTDNEKMEERFYDIDSNYSNILGWAEDHLEFCPNDEPPSKEEILAWLWVIHPEWKEEIIKYADNKLKKIIKEYIEYHDDD